MKKITGEMIIDKLKELPESDQQTILDFIEYLLKKEEQRKKKKTGNKKKA
jgi:mRNA-degrading endonuclease RelE of RelBE toxin-antitoxin system